MIPIDNQDQLTLEPADRTDPDDLARIDNARYMLTFAHTAPALGDDWPPAQLSDGRTVDVRAKDCEQPGCRCAGEFRWAGGPDA